MEAATMPKKVLVVDDDPDMREAISMLIKIALPEVIIVEAENGEEAQSILDSSATAIGAVVTDFDFRVECGITGLDLIDWVRQKYPGIPILLCSAHPLEGEAEEFIRKPFSIEDFNNIFNQLIAKIKKPAI